MDNVKVECSDMDIKTASPPPAESNPTTFSSENFKICIHNLPKYVDPKELKKFMKRLEFDVKKAYVIRDHAYVCLSDEPSVIRALSLLQNYTWKKNVLRVKRAAANVDPVLAAASNAKKKTKSTSDSANTSTNETSETSPPEVRLLDAVSPLHKMPYDDQLALKQKETEELLKQISQNISSSAVNRALPASDYLGELKSILPSPLVNGYRNKCEFSIGYNADRRPVVGFRLTRYKAGSTEIVSPVDCVHLPELTKSIVVYFQKFLDESSLLPYDVTTRKGFWSMLTVRQFLMDTMVIVTVSPREVSQDTIESVKSSLIDLFSSSALDDAGIRVTSLFFQRLDNSSHLPVYEYLSGVPYCYENVLGLRFRISPGAFFQVNTAGCEILYKSLLDVCEIDSDTLVVDFCCGTGTIGITLAGKAGKVIGIESCSEAVEDARINAKNNNRTNCEFICGKVEKVMDDVRRRINDATATYNKMIGVLDPPRSGVNNKVISTIRQLPSMKTLLYVSCNPQAASKNFVDLTRRSSNRYPGDCFQLKSVQPVDLFPHTKHCEWVLVFER